MSTPLGTRARKLLTLVGVGAAGLAGLAAAGGAAIGLEHPSVQASAATPAAALPALSPVPAPGGYADLVERVAPSIVTVRSERLVETAGYRSRGRRGEQLPPFFRGFGLPDDQQPRRQSGLGSGVVVNTDGTILTNHHVVEGAGKVKVELSDRRTFEARVVGTDAPSDLAVLKIEAKGLRALSLGDSDAVRVGDVVLAFGNPLGVGQTVTMGIVSAKGRATGFGDGSFEDFLQTDAPINQGNSGGALVSTSGQLVGINSQILSGSGGNIGIGFAIPAQMARSVMTQLVGGGEVHRGLLGVTVQGVTSDLAQSLGLPDVAGALVSDVTPDSPAARAGIERGDVLVRLEGQPVTDANVLRNRIASTRPGSTVSVGLVRDGQEKTVRVELGELKTARTAGGGAPEREESGRLGLAVQPLRPEDAKELGISSKTGLLVSEVDPDGPAAEAGLQPGDVIEQVNRRPVTDVAGLRAAVKASGDKPSLFLVNRRGGRAFLTVEAPRA